MNEYETVFNDEMPPDMYDLGYESGHEEEQERILKALNSADFTIEVFEWFSQMIPHSEPLDDGAVTDLTDRLIALIKGEK
jgi:hypothetical protein